MIATLFVLIALGGIYYFVLYPYQKIKRIKRSPVIKVNGAEERYPGLPLGTIGFFFSADRDYRVQVIFPRLTRYSKVEYLYSWHDIRAVQIPDLRDASHQEKIDVAVAQELTALVRDHVQLIEPEILALRQQWHELQKLLNLVETSEVYAGHKSVYEKALFQVESLANKAEELQLEYVRSIREILIGRQVASYDPTLVTDNGIIIDYKHKQIKEEYQMMKEVATAHAELLRTSQF